MERLHVIAGACSLQVEIQALLLLVKFMLQLSQMPEGFPHL